MGSVQPPIADSAGALVDAAPARADHSRFVQRVRRRFEAECRLLPTGTPDTASIAALIDQLTGQGRPLASALRIARNAVIDRLAVLDVEQAAALAAITATMTTLAEEALERALAQALAEEDERSGAPLDAAGARIEFWIVGMGKLKGRMIVKMSDKILFDPGKTKLKEEGQNALKQLAGVLKDIADRDFLVAGYTDNVPIKSRQFKSNWDPSAARAVEVVKFMQAEGVDPKHLGAAGFSEYDAVGDNATDEGRRSNRRIEVVLMPNIEELPKLD